jgi:hypothetical protein
MVPLWLGTYKVSGSLNKTTLPKEFDPYSIICQGTVFEKPKQKTEFYKT